MLWSRPEINIIYIRLLRKTKNKACFQKHKKRMNVMKLSQTVENSITKTSLPVPMSMIFLFWRQFSVKTKGWIRIKRNTDVVL